MEVVKNSKSIVFVMLIDFVYTIIMAILLIGLGVIFNLLVGVIVCLVFELAMVIISRTTLYKKCPKRIEELEI